MRHFKKISLSILFSIIALLTIAIIVFVSTFNPNDYTQRIDKLVYTKTGRHLSIQGKIGLSFFPWLGLSIQDVSLSNPPGFKPSNLVHIDQIKVKVRLLPLLKKEIQLGTVELDGADLYLLTNRAGANNWSISAPKSKATESTPSKASPAKNDSDLAVAAAALAIAGINIEDSSVHVMNAKTGQQLSLVNIHLLTGNISSQETFPVELSFDVKSKTTFPVSLKTNLTSDLNRQKVELSNTTIKLANMTISGQLTAKQLFTTPSISGALSSQGTDLKTFLKMLQGKSTMTGALSFNSRFSTSGKTSQSMINNLNATGGLSILKGSFAGHSVLDLIERTNALLNLNIKSLTSTSDRGILFSDFSETHTVKQGIMNSSIKLTGSTISANGKGLINLKNQTINYNITAQHNGIQSSAASAGFEIPITITGSLLSPKIRPELSGAKTKIDIIKGIKNIDLRDLF